MDFFFRAFESNTIFFLLITAIIATPFSLLINFITERLIKRKPSESQHPTIQIKNNSGNKYFSDNTINSNNTTHINNNYYSTYKDAPSSNDDILAYGIIIVISLALGTIFFSKFSSMILFINTLTYFFLIGIYLPFFKRNHGKLPNFKLWISLSIYLLTLIAFAYWWKDLSSIRSYAISTSYQLQPIISSIIRNTTHRREITLMFFGIISLLAYSYTILFVLKEELLSPNKSKKFTSLLPVYIEFFLVFVYVIFYFIQNLSNNKPF